MCSTRYFPQSADIFCCPNSKAGQIFALKRFSLFPSKARNVAPVSLCYFFLAFGFSFSRRNYKTFSRMNLQETDRLVFICRQEKGARNERLDFEVAFTEVEATAHGAMFIVKRTDSFLINQVDLTLKYCLVNSERPRRKVFAQLKDYAASFPLGGDDKNAAVSSSFHFAPMNAKKVRSFGAGSYRNIHPGTIERCEADLVRTSERPLGCVQAE